MTHVPGMEKIAPAHVDSPFSFEFLAPEKLPAQLLSLDKVSAGMVAEINCVFEEILKNKDASVTRLTGGVERLAEILNQSDEHSSQLVLSEIEESDPALAAQGAEIVTPPGSHHQITGSLPNS